MVCEQNNSFTGAPVQTKMAVAKRSLRKLFLDTVPRNVTPYAFPPLSSVNVADLPNNGFGQGNYHIPKTQFGHWPVYLKVQNTKRTTEIKRLQGDLNQFKTDLLAAVPGLEPTHITTNLHAGLVNIKGDLVEMLKGIFTDSIK